MPTNNSPHTLTPYVPTSGFQHTAPANPEWAFAQSVESTLAGQAWAEGEKDGWTVFDTEKEEPSWFNQVTSYPPILSISILHRPQSAKDTLKNILDMKEFTANLISEPWIQQANISAVDTPADVGEWPITGLTKASCVQVKPVKESACSMEYELLQTIDIKYPATGIITTTLVLGSIKHIHIRNDVLNHDRGTIDPGKMKPVARMAGVGYARISDGYHIGLPSWTASQDAIRDNVPGLEQSAMENSNRVGYEAERVD